MIVGASSANRQAAAPQLGQCPHGSVPGVCAVCGGGGGGGGGKTRGAGLMSWNEAWAVWNAIQVGKRRNTDYLLAVDRTRDRQMLETQNAGFKAALSALIAKSQAVAAGFMQALGRVFSPAGGMMNALRPMAQWTAQLGQTLRLGPVDAVQMAFSRIMDMAEKLAIVLGDWRQRIEDGLRRAMAHVKKLIYEGMIARLITAVSFQGLKEFTGQVIEKVSTWLFGRKRHQEPKEDTA